MEDLQDDIGEHVHIHELTSFPYSAQKCAVRGVPETVINEGLELVGMVRRSEIAKKAERMPRG